MKIFFDVDGVLIRGWHADGARRQPWDSRLEADLGVNAKLFQQRFFNTPVRGASSTMHACLIGECDLKEALDSVLPELGYRGSVEEFIRYWFDKDAHVDAEIFGLIEQIKRNSDIRLFLATGQEHRRAHYLWENLGFRRHFEVMFYSAEVGYLKKDLRFFESINRAIGFTGEESSIFFDDQPEIVEIARSAGWDAVIYEAVNDIKEHPRLRSLFQEASSTTHRAP